MGLSINKVSNLCDVTRVNLSKIIHVILGQALRTVERNKYAVGAACRRPFAASQTRGGCKPPLRMILFGKRWILISLKAP